MPAALKLGDVLAALREFGEDGARLSELATAADLAPKTVRKHLKTLVEEGYAVTGKQEDYPFHKIWRSIDG